MARRFVCVEMKLSKELTRISPVVDQTRVLSLRTGQQRVPEVRNARLHTIAGRVETYGYHQIRNVIVEQNNLHVWMIGWTMVMRNSVVPPPPLASAPEHQMEMDTVM